ncbi:MAG: hypothetical protein ABI981_10630 [Betaproteobacteria bacterium]
MFTAPEAALALQAADLPPSQATPDDVGVAATTTTSQPLSAASSTRARWRLLQPDQFLLAYIGAILIAAAYAAYRTNTAASDEIAVASQAIDARAHNAPAVAPAPAKALESTLAESEAIVALAAPIPPDHPETPKRASARQHPVPVSATKRASAHQRRIPEARQPDPWQTMRVRLARCDGDLFARIACRQHVRRSYCEGRWGEVPECSSGIAIDRGQ